MCKALVARQATIRVVSQEVPDAINKRRGHGLVEQLADVSRLYLQTCMRTSHVCTSYGRTLGNMKPTAFAILMPRGQAPPPMRFPALSTPYESLGSPRISHILAT